MIPGIILQAKNAAFSAAEAACSAAGVEYPGSTDLYKVTEAAKNRVCGVTLREVRVGEGGDVVVALLFPPHDSVDGATALQYYWEVVLKKPRGDPKKNSSASCMKKFLQSSCHLLLHGSCIDGYQLNPARFKKADNEEEEEGKPTSFAHTAQVFYHPQLPIDGVGPHVGSLPVVGKPRHSKARKKKEQTALQDRTRPEVAKVGKDGNNEGPWTSKEHETFVSAYQKHGKDWKKVTAVVKTRTITQIRTHGYKYIQKLQKKAASSKASGTEKEEEEASLLTTAQAIKAASKVDDRNQPRVKSTGDKKRKPTSRNKRKAPTDGGGAAKRAAVPAKRAAKFANKKKAPVLPTKANRAPSQQPSSKLPALPPAPRMVRPRDNEMVPDNAMVPMASDSYSLDSAAASDWRRAQQDMARQASRNDGDIGKTPESPQNAAV